MNEADMILESYLDEYVAENGLDVLLNEDIGLDNGFQPLMIGNSQYINSKTTMMLKYKGKDCPVTVYYKREFGRFNKNELNKVFRCGAANIAQDVANGLDSKPELILWDNEGMRIVFFDKNGNTKITPYFIHK